MIASQRVDHMNGTAASIFGFDVICRESKHSVQFRYKILSEIKKLFNSLPVFIMQFNQVKITQKFAINKNSLCLVTDRDLVQTIFHSFFSLSTCSIGLWSNMFLFSSKVRMTFSVLW